MATTQYHTKQFVGPGEISPSKIENITVETLKRRASSGDTLDCQQIIIRPTGGRFLSNTTYYIELTMPRDKNFDLKYGLRLLNIEGASEADLDADKPPYNNYQLIKYITVPKVNTSGQGYDNVALYQLYDEGWDNTQTFSAVFKDCSIGSDAIESKAELEEEYADSLAGRLFKIKNDIFYLYDLNGQIVNGWGNGKTEGQGEDQFGMNQLVISHDWNSSQTDSTSTFEFSFTPINPYDILYLWLDPIDQDNDIKWTADGQTYYGRHIENLNQIAVSIWSLPNVLSTITSNINNTIKNIGVWGRPELVMNINGEEIKIGPSGYYELRDYNVKNLSIAAVNNADKYTVDCQYITS